MRALKAGVLLVTAAVPLVGCGTDHATDHARSTPAAPTAPAASWHFAAGPQPGPKDGSFSVNAMTGASATDVWAIGSMSGGPNKGNDGDSNALAFHYDGKAWTRVTPPGTKAVSQLSDVATSSSSDVWAVGSDAGGLLVDHFDGRRWTALHPIGMGSANAVAAHSPQDVWVAGILNPGFKCSSSGCVSDTANDRPVLAHFDGKQWRRTGGILDTDVHAVVTSLTARGPDDVWASGSWQVTPHTPEGEQPLVAHWDGHQWTRVNVPLSVKGPARVARIVVTGHNEVWATGSYGNVQGIVDVHPYVLRFDGTNWRQIPTDGLTNPLATVAPDGHGGLWATDQPISGSAPLLRHFNGTSWTSVPVQGSPKGISWAQLTSLNGALWAAGQSDNGSIAFANT